MLNDATPPDGGPLIERDRPEPEESRAALVGRWQKDILAAAKHWKKDFDRMRRDMKFAGGKQWPNQREEDDRYVANIVQRIVKVMVASMYARNPKAIVGRRPRLDFALWDGDAESAIQAQQTMEAAQMAEMAARAAFVTGDAEAVAAVQDAAPDPVAVQQAQALLADIQQGLERRRQLDRIGETMACLLQYYLTEGTQSFKRQMKRVIKRARTCGVGYVKLGFQRMMELSEEQDGRINDMSERLAVIGRLQADIADGETDPFAAEGEELRLAIETIRAEPEVIVREGLVFSYPHSTRIIPSISTESLIEWTGAEWVAEEIMLTPDKVKQIYGKDVTRSYRAYQLAAGAPESSAHRPAGEGKQGMVRVWHVCDQATGMELVLAEGYPDFLREPAAPQVFIEQFFPIFAITFNDVEVEGELFPKSDVHHLTHIQKEYNRSKEALRQHRWANRPLYLMPADAMDEDETKSFAGHAAHDVIKLRGLKDNETAEKLVSPMRKVGIDPGMYETAGLFEDMSRVTGNQEAILGGLSKATATESNIAESSRQGTIGLDADDLDDALTAIFRAAGQIMLTELSEETVKRIVGPGAIWPTLSRQEVMEEVWLEVKGGSTGRPDQAREAANFERMAPLLLQIPGIRPQWLAEKMVRIADDGTDLTDAFADGLPSILSQNRLAQLSTGDPATDPNAQGPEGEDRNRPERSGGQDTRSFPTAADAG